jgi:23S rRNA (uridine2552-2'-O)-methyltransferase
VAAYTRKDGAYREAKRSGYRSRAALKLVELDRKFHLFAPGDRVLDLGCWPGGWLQIAAERVGPHGRVVGIDLAPTEPIGLEYVTSITADVADPAARHAARAALGGPANLILSDMAPKLTGIRVADAERHLALVQIAADWAAELLAARGRVLIKLFSDVESEAAKLLAESFATVHKHRPSSTRKGSSEIYALAESPRRPAR